MRNVRRGRCRQSRFYEPLQGGDLVFSRTREGGSSRFQSFVPLRVWPGIRSSFERTVQAMAFLEIVTMSITEGESQPGAVHDPGAFSQPDGERGSALAGQGHLRPCNCLWSAAFRPGSTRASAARHRPSRPAPDHDLPGRRGVVCRSCLPGRREEMIR